MPSQDATYTLSMQDTAVAFFMPAGKLQRFCIHHPPVGKARGAVLYVHPFAEEMNKSRRVASLQARALANSGFAVLQIDLLGCGDSGGDFADATWARWVEDVLMAAQWLQARYDGPLWFWGLRAGCLLAAEAASKLAKPCHLLFWQPMSSGKQVLQQFLRLQLAGDMLDGSAKGAMTDLRAQLAAGETVEIAGYELSAELAGGLEGSDLQVSPGPGRLHWMELSLREDACVSPAASRILSAWRDTGWQVDSRVVRGPAFWHTVELEEAPALISVTVDTLS